MKLVNRMSFLSSSVMKEIILSSETFYGVPPPFWKTQIIGGRCFYSSYGLGVGVGGTSMLEGGSWGSDNGSKSWGGASLVKAI